MRRSMSLTGVCAIVLGMGWGERAIAATASKQWVPLKRR